MVKLEMCGWQADHPAHGPRDVYDHNVMCPGVGPGAGLDYPVCSHCGSGDLEVRYKAECRQDVMLWSRDGNTWKVELYDSADIDFNAGLRSVILSCFSCGEVVARQTAVDRFKVKPYKERPE